MAGRSIAATRVRRVVAGSLTLLVLAAVTALLLQSPPEKIPDFRRAPMTVVDGVHMLGATSPSVAYAVETGSGFVLIDTGIDPSCQSVLQQLWTLGLDVQQLEGILLTHGHGDHFLGADHLRRISGARVFAGERDCAVIREGHPESAVFSRFGTREFEMLGQFVPYTDVDVELAGGERLSFGDVTFEVIATPGHTPGSLCFLLVRDGRRMLFSGDTVMTGRELGTYSAYLAPKYRGSAREFRESLERLRRLEAPDLLFPGHPILDSSDPGSPLVDSARWTDLLRSGETEMGLLLKRYQTDGSDFLDGTSKELLPGLFYQGTMGETGIYCVVDDANFYVVNAPTGLASQLPSWLDERGMDGVTLRAVIVTSTAGYATAGLDSLVSATGCAVIAVEEMVDELRALVPAETEFVEPAESKSVFGLPLMATEVLADRLAPVVYRLSWEGREVVLSGPIPSRAPLSRRTVRQANGLSQLLDRDARDVEFQLQRLGTPDLWLPDRPVDDQNANLYGDDWSDAVEATLRLAK